MSRRKTNPVPTLAVLVKKIRARGVVETLQAGGDVPSVTEANATELDWVYTLQEGVTETAHLARQLSISDTPEEINYLRLHLAKLIVRCEAWDKLLVKDIKAQIAK